MRNIIFYKDDIEYIPGCPTCDYGSEYINTEISNDNYCVEWLNRKK